MHKIIRHAVILTIAVFASASMVYAQTVDGQLRVSFSAIPIDIDTSKLESLISQAETLLNDTQISADGRGISPTDYWATEAVHNTFYEAIKTARNTLQKLTSNEITFNETARTVGTLMRGQSFTMTLRIENNTGFATMPLRLHVPQGLELTHVNTIDLRGMIITFPLGHDEETGEIDTITGARNTHVSSVGSSNFAVTNADLWRFTFRVSENTALERTQPITLSFANARGASPPTTRDGDRLNILLPGENSGIIANVIIATE